MDNQKTFLETLRESKLIPLNIQLFSEGEEGSGNEENNEDEENEDEGEGQPPKTFTQEEVSRMMAREKRQGKNSAYKELGFKSDKEAKESLKAFKEWQESQKTKEEKEIEAKKKIETEMTQAQKKAELAERKITALTNGVKTSMLDDFIALASIKVTEDKDFEEVIEDMKKTYKTFFNDSEDDQEDQDEESKAKGTGSSSRSKKKGAVQSAYGQRLAEQRKPKATKSSYFN